MFKPTMHNQATACQKHPKKYRRKRRKTRDINRIGFHKYQLNTHPLRAVVVSFTLCQLVVVMRKLQVNAPAVNVYLWSKYLEKEQNMTLLMVDL